MRASITACLGACLFAGCLAALRSIGYAASPSPAASQSGETSTPIRLVTQPNAAAFGSPAPPISQATLPASIAGVTPIGNLGQRAFFPSSGGIEAIDLATGKSLWHAANTFVNEGTVPIGHDLIFAMDTHGYNDMVALSVGDGTVRYRVPRAKPGNVVDGVMYGTYHDQFSAIDASDGKAIWTGFGAGTGPSGGTRIVGNLLLQEYVDDGAILQFMLDAFDVRTGRALWSHVSATEPLGYGPGTVYLDATWSPSQMDSYVPLDVDTVALATGKTLHSYSYAPDPTRNAGVYLNEPRVIAHAGGGYLYLRVGGTWYRYLADRPPASPLRLDGVVPSAWFGGNRMLVETPKGAAIARSFSDRIEIQPLGHATLQSPIFTRSDGTQYAVIGGELIAFDSAGTPRVAGRASCTTVTSMLFWNGRVAVLCKNAAGASASLVFADRPSLPLPIHARPQAPAPKSHYFRVRSYAIPPNETGFGDKQWFVNTIVPLSGGGAVLPLDTGTTNLPGAIGFVSSTGTVRLIPLAAGPPAILPASLAVDAGANVYFSDINSTGVTKLAPTGAMSYAVATSPPAAPVRRGGLLLATVAGGVWFARNDPHPQIGDAGGSAIYDVPTSFGRITAIAPATTGDIWFETKSKLGRMTLKGTFREVPLPQEIAAYRNYPDRILATASDGAIWVGAGSLIAHIDADGKTRTYRLPGDTSSAAAMAEGCDRALYVYEGYPQIARIAPEGTLEEFPITVDALDGLARAPDCKLWYIAGSNLPTQQAGTLEFLPKP